MNPIRISALFAAFLVSACATPPDQIRLNPPKISANMKSVDRVVACFSERYDGIGFSQFIRVTPRMDGGQTIKRIAKQAIVGEAYAFVIDITPKGSGSEVRIYEQELIGTFDRTIFSACTA